MIIDNRKLPRECSQDRVFRDLTPTPIYPIGANE